nr:probable bifunctional methylthioribulose-1-phosphate dehydratase/enolase-phosphatase E1 1 [Ipomoea batatas]
MAAGAPLVVNGAVKMANTSQAYLEVHDDSIPKPQQLIVMSPSGVQKERMMEEDMYVLSPIFFFSFFFFFFFFCGVLCLTLQAECYHYLFDAAIKLHQLGLDWSTPTHGPIRKSIGVLGSLHSTKASAKEGSVASNGGIGPSRRCIVLDIEGTTTPISFVSDVLFPYARDNVGRHLDITYNTAETQDDIKLLRAQVEEDLQNGVAGAVPIPHDDAGKEEVIAALVTNVEAMIKADRKITSLKQLQGHIWRTGFQHNELEAIVYDDVPEALEKWNALGIKVYIYSSGSRLAQRLLFGNTNHGDLRNFLCGFFDTTVGNKKEMKSYIEITESLGVDNPSEILFMTDVYQEATAAKAAGLEVIISVRPGNGPLPENNEFRTVKSFADI